MDFPQELYLPPKTIFRKGSALAIAKEALEFGARGLIIHGNSFLKGNRRERILSQFPAWATVESFCRGRGEPTLDELGGVIEKVRVLGAEWVVGIGGGSALDLAKAAAGLCNAQEKPVFYQEGGELKERGIPFIAVPTTAGTGSEATPNAVIINKEKKAKFSIRDRGFLARTVILDAELLQDAPSAVIRYAGMDALVQGYESFISRNATWLSDTLALKAIDLINRNILSAHASGNEEGLSSLLLGSYLAGIALASARLGVIHGLAHPLGALYEIPHGLICSVCFVPSVRLNREAMGKKYEILSDVVGMDFLERVKTLLATLGITSPFKNQILTEKEKIIQETLTSGSTAANPRKIERSDLEFILGEIF